MKFNMGLNMMDMVAVVEKRLSDIKFPFIVIHDPEDGENSRRREVGPFFAAFFSSSRRHVRMGCAGESQAGARLLILPRVGQSRHKKRLQKSIMPFPSLKVARHVIMSFRGRPREYGAPCNRENKKNETVAPKRNL